MRCQAGSGAALPGRKALGGAALEGCRWRAGPGAERADAGDDRSPRRELSAALTL